MKRLILSRKGFDSSSGGCPNPILPDGRMIALPIPDAQSPVRYRDLADGGEVANLATQLSGDDMAHEGAHLDPDLCITHRPRLPDWRPVLGQHGAAEGHLRKQGVGAGDLFLFFGLFRPVERVRRRWQFVAHQPARHLIWGWLHVAQKVDLSEQAVPPCYAEHPHAHGERGRNNALYVARPHLTVTSSHAPRQAQREPEKPDTTLTVAGAGIFPAQCPELTLTDPHARLPSEWRLPAWWYPEARTPMSYHQRMDRWQQQAADSGEFCSLRAVARGQEFVLRADEYPELQPWLYALFKRGMQA